MIPLRCEMGFIKGVTFEVPEGYFTDIAKEVIAEDEDYWPFILSIESDHASYVEFGTQGRPIRDKSEKGSGLKDSKMFDNLKKWLIARGGPNDDAVVHQIMKKIIKEGSPPQPFVRPAVHDIEDLINRGEYEHKTMQHVIDDLLFLLVDYLNRNHTIYEGGEILKTIKIEKVNPNDGRLESESPSIDDHAIDEAVWASRESDLRGNIRPRYNRHLRF